MSETDKELAKTSFAYQRKRMSGLQKLLAKHVPRQLLRRLKRVILLPADGLDLLLDRRRELVPPHHLNFAGDGDFEAGGDEFLKYFVELGGLDPAHRVLEVGSGIGRMARPLTKYLSTGSYEGIDIVPQGIEWCQKNISGRYPNFRFQLADVRNLMYNPRGRFEAAEYRFPFADGEFDFIYLTSVYTHLLRRDMEHYLAEIARSLRPKGICVATYFLLNTESRSLMKAGRSSLDFKYPLDGCWTDDEVVPEHAIAFDEEYIRGLCRDLSLNIETVRAGAWCGRQEYLSYQDIVVAKKI
jgi:SAM-dependent methyltransferase